MRLTSASLYVNSFDATGTPGEYTFDSAIWNNASDTAGNGAYAAQLNDLIFVQATDLNLFSPIPGVVHRYKLTALTVVDGSTLSGTMLWDEPGAEEDAPTNGSYCLYAQASAYNRLGAVAHDSLYPGTGLGLTAASLILDMVEIVDPLLGSGGAPYVLPEASLTTLGGVKQGANIFIAADGTISTSGAASAVTSVSGRQGAILLTVADIGGLAPVALSGAYADLDGKPVLATVATSGLYADLSGKPVLATVATTGSYLDLFNKPNLADVATSGSYADLSGKPALAQVANTGLYADLVNKPVLSTVALSGAYADLTGKPTIPAAYTLPSATDSIKGGVKIGQGISVAGDGTISVASGGAGGGGVFVTSVVPDTTGAVTNEIFAPNTVPANAKLVSADTTAARVRVHVGATGGPDAYTPTVEVNGVAATLVESTTVRWFTGYAVLDLNAGLNVISITSTGGGSDTVSVTASGIGSTISNISFGAYPGAQTALKAGDLVPVIINCSGDTAQVVVSIGGASDSEQTFAATGGVATGNLVVGSASGNQSVTAVAKNSFGASGDPAVSPDLTLDQAPPILNAISVGYPNGKLALADGDIAQVSCTASGFSSIVYIPGSNLSIPNSTLYEVTKAVTCVGAATFASGINYTINVAKASNGTVASSSVLVELEGIAPTATTTVVGAPPRLVSSPTGQSYTVRISPNQVLSTAPNLVASVGTWSGSWTLVGANWERPLLISDSDAKGGALFSGLVLSNKAHVGGSTITSGASYTVGGFALRTITYAAFSQLSAIGTTVTDISKVHAHYTGVPAELAKRSDVSNFAAGFTVTDGAGVYDPTGTHCFLTDASFAGSNTTGTLQVDVWETA